MASSKISFYRGDTPLITVTVPITGTALASATASDYTASFTLTSNIKPTSDTDSAIQLNVTPTVVSSTEWKASFQLTNTHTQSLDPDTLYYYDCQLRKTSDNSLVLTVAAGPCVIRTDYTRRVA